MFSVCYKWWCFKSSVCVVNGGALNVPCVINGGALNVQCVL